MLGMISTVSCQVRQIDGPKHLANHGFVLTQTETFLIFQGFQNLGTMIPGPTYCGMVGAEWQPIAPISAHGFNQLKQTQAFDQIPNLFGHLSYLKYFHTNLFLIGLIESRFSRIRIPRESGLHQLVRSCTMYVLCTPPFTRAPYLIIVDSTYLGTDPYIVDIVLTPYPIKVWD